MGPLSLYLKKLERLGTPSPSVIRATRMLKILRKIGRLGEIPGDIDCRFRKRVERLHGKGEEIVDKDEQHALSPTVPQPGDGKVEPAAVLHSHPPAMSLIA